MLAKMFEWSNSCHFASFQVKCSFEWFVLYIVFSMFLAKSVQKFATIVGIYLLNKINMILKRFFALWRVIHSKQTQPTEWLNHLHWKQYSFLTKNSIKYNSFKRTFHLEGGKMTRVQPLKHLCQHLIERFQT